MARAIARETLQEWMRGGAGIDLVDTLPRTTYERHHLPAAIHIASDDIETEAPRRLPDRGRTVVVYCDSAACKRSEMAVARLDALGYGDVREYVDVRRHWEAAGLRLESGPDPQGLA